MLRHVNGNVNQDGRKFLIASATVAAMVVPLSFATPAISIERAQSNVEILRIEKGTPDVPSHAEFDNAKQKFEAQEQVYQKKIQAYNQAKAENLPLPNYQQIVSEQNTKVDTLNGEIQPLINQLLQINIDVNNINTTNANKLNQLLQAYNSSSQEAKDAQSTLNALHQQIDQKVTSDKAKIDELNAKANAAEQDMQQKQADFEAFKTTYEPKAAAYEKQKTQYETKLSNINSQIQNLKGEIANLPKDNTNGYGEVKTNASSLQKQINELQAQYNSVNTEYKSISATFDELSSKYAAFKTAYENAKAAVDAANANISATNQYIEQENAAIKQKCDTAQQAYDKATATHKELEDAYKKQVVEAQSENKKNDALYADLKGKIDQLSTLVDEYNAKRIKLGDEAQAAKTSIDDAYKAAQNAYTILSDIRQTAIELGTEYNVAAAAYNTEVQNEYNTKLKAYNDAQAKFEVEVQKLKDKNKENGVLSVPAWQGLSFGDGPMRQIADGGLTWENAAGSTVVEGNKLFAEIPPQQTATAVYTGNAVKGIIFAGKQVSSMRVSYQNQNAEKVSPQNGAAGPVWIGADADIRAGYSCCYKITNDQIQTPMRPGSAFSYDADRPDWTHFFVTHGNVTNSSQGQNLIIAFEFYDEDGQRIQFSEKYPADLYLPNLYKEKVADGGVTHIKLLGSNIFNEIIPIVGSAIDNNQDVYVYNPNNGKPFLVHTQVTVSKDFSTPSTITDENTWKEINNPDFYKNCILTVQNTGSRIAFAILSNNLLEADTPASRNYAHANDLGYDQMFLTNIASVELPMAPTIEKPVPPSLAQNVNLGLTDIGDAPVLEKVDVPDVVLLNKPIGLSPLSQITPKNVVPTTDLKEGRCPAPVNTIPMRGDVKQIEALGVIAPKSPEQLPEVPDVPTMPVSFRKNTPRHMSELPKTDDKANIVGLSIATSLGTIGLLLGSKNRGNR